MYSVLDKKSFEESKDIYEQILRLKDLGYKKKI
jgi:hypothetical protein